MIDGSASVEGGGVALGSQAELHYRGTFLIRPTAGRVPALKVQFRLPPPVGIVAPLKEATELLAAFEIEMLKIKRGGKKSDGNYRLRSFFLFFFFQSGTTCKVPLLNKSSAATFLPI